MRWVDQAITRPFRCAVVPYAGNGSGRMFIDTGQDLDLEHVYISDVAAEQIAKMLGWVPPATVDTQAEQIAELNAKLSEATAEIESLREYERASQYTLEHFGEKVRRKPGRKPSNEKVAQ